MAADGHIEIDTRINSERVGPDLAALSERIGKVGEGLKTAGENMSLYVSAPLAALGGAAMKMSSDVEKSQGKLQAQLGITAKQAEHLTEVSKDVWKEGYGESLEEVSDSIAIIQQQMGDLGDEDLKSATEGAYTLSEAFGVDVSESTRAAKQLMDQFGVSSTDAFDMITTGFQRGGDYSGELLDTISEYSVQFKNMGFEADEMMGLFVSGAESGIWSLDKLGDAVKESFLQITDGADNTNKTLDSIGLNHEKIISDIQAGGDKANGAWMAVMTALTKIEDPAKRNKAAIELMGTPLEDLGPQYQEFFAQAGVKLEGFEGSTKKAGEALHDNFGDKLKTIFREALVDLQPVGDILLNMAENVLPKISSAINEAATWFANLSPFMQQVVVVGGALLAALGPLLMFIGQIATGISAIVGWIAPLVAGIAEAGGLMAWLGGIFSALTGPVGLIVLAVVGLVAAFVALWRNNEAFRDKVVEIWEQIKTAFFTAITFIKDSVVVPIMSAIVAFAKSILDKLKAFWKENGSTIMADVSTVWNVILGIIKSVLNLIKAAFQVVWPIITGIIKIAWSVIKAVISVALDIILGIVNVFIKVFSGNWKGAWEAIKNTFKNIWESIKSAFKNLNLAEIGRNVIQGLVNGFNSAKSAVVGAVRSIAKLIPDGIKSFLHIKSPSRLMRDDVGKWIPEGLAEGIEKNSHVVAKAAIKMSTDAIPDIPNYDSQFRQIIPQLKNTSSSTQIKIASADNSGILKVVEKALSRPIQASIDGKQMTMILAPHIQNAVDDLTSQRNRWEGLTT